MARILLVDDEEYIGDAYQELLKRSGFEIDVVLNGKTCLNALKSNSYDIILLDIILPDISGLDILQKIRMDEKTKKIPVILLTNLDQDVVIKKGMELGANSYLLKVQSTPDIVLEEVKKFIPESS